MATFRNQSRQSPYTGCALKSWHETLKAKAKRSKKSVMFRYLTDLGNHCNMFYKQLKTRGRPPSGYAQLDQTGQNTLLLQYLIPPK